MIGLDTNILVRLIVEDDPAQTRRAAEFLERRCSPQSPGFVNHVTLCEMVWVLGSRYGFDRASIVASVSGFLDSADMAFADAALIRNALARFETSSMGFTDLLIAEINRAAGCSATATFDRRASRAEGFTAVP